VLDLVRGAHHGEPMRDRAEVLALYRLEVGRQRRVSDRGDLGSRGRHEVRVLLDLRGRRITFDERALPRRWGWVLGRRRRCEIDERLLAVAAAQRVALERRTRRAATTGLPLPSFVLGVAI
jgi:hypothetical protein